MILEVKRQGCEGWTTAMGKVQDVISWVAQNGISIAHMYQLPGVHTHIHTCMPHVQKYETCLHADLVRQRDTGIWKEKSEHVRTAKA